MCKRWRGVWRGVSFCLVSLTIITFKPSHAYRTLCTTATGLGVRGLLVLVHSGLCSVCSAAAGECEGQRSLTHRQMIHMVILRTELTWGQFTLTLITLLITDSLYWHINKSQSGQHVQVVEDESRSALKSVVFPVLTWTLWSLRSQILHRLINKRSTENHQHFTWSIKA